MRIPKHKAIAIIIITYVNGNDHYYFNDDGKVAPYEASVDCPVISPIIKKNKNMTAVATAEDEGRRGEREEGILTPNFTPR